MELIRSNRTEALADALASLVRREPLGPFQSEAIVVQSRGMERWLTLALAERLGVWGNPSFPFPRAAIEQVLDDLSLGPSEESKAYDPGRLKWTIAELLHESTPGPLRSYLGATADPDRVLRLSSSLSAVFDGYVVHRPERLKQWTEGVDSHWQAELWRRVVNRLGPHDLASRIERALHALRSKQAAAEVRFKRLHLFSLETLPPLFLHFFEALAQTTPALLYLLEPTSEYVSGVDDTPQLSLPIDAAPSDGHPLVTSLGRLARDFQELLLVSNAKIQREEDLFVAPLRRDLLASLQADILEFRVPQAGDDKPTLDAADPSITIHACTSPMREVQVLHDVIRTALEDDPSLLPEDVVVMAADIEAYAPVFRAVFGQDDPQRVPYEVHDRKTRDDASFYDDFLSVLEVLDSRFSVLDLMRLMDARSMREEFRFTADERARLSELLDEAGVRWGIDPAHRTELGFPAEALHTWRAGLGRLFLGFTSIPDATEVFDGLLPRGALSLGDAELVARLAGLCEILFDLHQRARRPISVPQWVNELGRLSGVLFAEEDDDTGAVRILRSALEELRALASKSTYTREIPLRTVRRELAGLLRRGTPAAGFLRRGVTLSELVPLRSIPFRMVCLIGMSEESFPRADDRPSFDLTRERHHLGDRNKRDDDRHSFLQALLCARDRFVITYSAPVTSLRSGATPSPLVWELCETVNRCYRREGTASPLTATHHPLHAFDRGYFDGELAPSFSERHLRIATEMTRPAIEPGPVELRAEPEPLGEVLPVAELSQWLWHPARVFIQKALRVRLETSKLYEPTHALTEVESLDAFRVGNLALEAPLRGEELVEYLRSAPEFPDGGWGALDREQLALQIEAINARHEEAAGAERSQLITVDLGEVTLEGRLSGLRGDLRTRKRFNKVGTKAELTTWVEHLLMQAAEDPALPTATQVILRGTDSDPDVIRFEPVENPRELLEALVELYRTSQRAPVPLLTRPSWVFAHEVVHGNPEDALAKARARLEKEQKWDRYVTYAWGKRGPFVDARWAEEFGRTTLSVYEPLLRHRSLR